MTSPQKDIAYRGKTSVYQFDNYAKFLAAKLPKKGVGRGGRAALARELNCQNAFISSVINGKSHLSLEHALKAARFLGLDPEGIEYFLLLIQKEKAGTKDLRDYLSQELRRRKASLNKSQTQQMLSTEEISVLSLHRYFSSWIYPALHTLCMIPDFQTLRALQERLSLDRDVLVDALEFLTKSGFLICSDYKFQSVQSRLHFSFAHGAETAFHQQWRIKALEALSPQKISNFHYTSTVALNARYRDKIEAVLSQAIKDSEKHIADSPCEDFYVLSVDLFRP